MSLPPARVLTVDGLRGLAALLVVIDHAIDESWGLGPWTQQNHGITIFALLTGFLLSGRFLRARLEGRRPPAVGAFLRARVARVFPGYWVVLGVAGLTIGLHSMESGDLFRVVTLTQTFDADTPYEGLIPMWSLSLFLSFYLFLPAWSWFRARTDGPDWAPRSLLRREVPWLLGLVAVACLARALSVTEGWTSAPEFNLLGRADWFAVGMLLSVLVIARSQGSAPPWPAWVGQWPSLAFGAAIALTVAAGLLPTGAAELRTQADLAAAALIVFAAVLHGPTLRGPQRLLASRPAQALGRWSYGIFLWGYFSEKAIAALIPGIGTGLLLALTIPAGIALGAASWRFIEKPASERFRRGRLARRARRVQSVGEPAAA